MLLSLDSWSEIIHICFDHLSICEYRADSNVFFPSKVLSSETYTLRSLIISFFCEMVLSISQISTGGFFLCNLPKFSFLKNGCLLSFPILFSDPFGPAPSLFKGFFFNKFLMRSLAWGGKSEGNLNLASQMLSSSSKLLMVLENKVEPVMHSYMMHPKAHKSEANHPTLCVIISGEM